MLRLLLVLLSFWNAPSAYAFSGTNNCTSGWKEVDWKIVPFPDEHARYLSYQFEIPKGKNIALQITGAFPVARYMSYHVYDQATENALGAILDSDIQEDAGSVNPYQVGVDRYSSNRNYTVWALPPESEVDAPNVLQLPSTANGKVRLDIWLRVYVNEGKIERPRILAFDANTKKPITCPRLHRKTYSIATEPGPLGTRIASRLIEGRVPLPFKSGSLHFFAPSSLGLGANVHNRYMSTRLDGKGLFDPRTVKGRIERRMLRKEGVIQDIGDIAILKFAPPSFPNTGAGLKEFTGLEEMRYWSVCLAGGDTRTSGCLLDQEAKVAEDGMIWLVVGPASPSLRKAVQERGMNFLSHATHRAPTLFYRQLLARPDFAGRIENVRQLSPRDMNGSEPIDEFFAEKFIGDFAPLGMECWRKSDFLEKRCGFR